VHWINQINGLNLTEQHTKTVRSLAQTMGFDECGIAAACKLDDDAKRLENWLSKGFHGEMKYMENHFDMRVDPTRLVPGAKSVITLLYNYYPEEIQSKELPQVAKYAYGKDYHLVIREKLKHFLKQINSTIGEVEGRGFVDSAPVLERAWAVKSGLGWVGKNGNLINKKKGSFFFIATLITDLELIPDQPYIQDYCGTCNKCIDACPTNAILPNKEIQANQCISYFTIELKDALLPQQYEGKADEWIFGCDICQDVCPWNRFSKPHQEKEFVPTHSILSFSIQDWLDLDKENFNTLFKTSPLKRSKWEGLRRNLSNYQLSITPSEKP
jgi:epoxyqueuosine reductase